jgi:hypothetical protein
MKLWLRRRPSPSMVVATVALVTATSGTAVAASHLVKGDKLIAKHSLSGNRLRAHTITGAQVNLGELGKVPSAASADTATNAASARNATSATTATNATNAVNASHASSADSATNATNASNLNKETVLNRFSAQRGRIPYHLDSRSAHPDGEV